MPVKNEVVNIKKNLQLILDQDYSHDNYEILISDGCSDDGTIDIVNSFIENYSNIKLIKNQKKIVSTGFNLALNQAKGDIIIRLDGHCEIPPNYFRDCLCLLQTIDADIVGGVIETTSTGLIGKSISIAQSSFFGVGGVAFRNSQKEESGYVDTLAFGAHKRDIFSDIGGYDEEMISNQDDEFNFRAIQTGKKIWIDPLIKTKYYSRSNFKKLSHQYFNYGYYKVRGIQKRRQIFSIRHLIPSIFILGLLGTLSIGFILGIPEITFFVVVVYLFFSIFSSLFLSQKLVQIPLIIIAFLMMHFSYGMGFIWGLIRFIGKWKETLLKDSHFNKQKFLANKSITL